MIAADHDRRRHLAVAHHLVEREAELRALSESHPADARRQPLKTDALARHVEPAMQMRIIRDELLHLRVGLVDVLRITRERRPAEWTDATAEERPDIRRHEAREIERVLDALF